MTITRKVSLSKQTNWETWLSFIQTKAIRSNVWNLINSSLAIKSTEFLKLVKSSPLLSKAEQQIYKNVVEIYKLLIVDFKLDLNEYDRQQRILTEITNFIHEIVSVQIESVFADNYFCKFIIGNFVSNVKILIEQFRNVVRLHQIVNVNQKNVNTDAFAINFTTFFPAFSNPKFFTFNGQRFSNIGPSSQPCICDDKY